MDAGINIFRNVLKKSFSFSGRIDRRQYWLFILLMLVIMAVCAWFTNKIPSLPLWQIFAILMLLPYVSATAKRLLVFEYPGSCLWLDLSVRAHHRKR